ncbi:hypothetical protein [Thiosulfativibrio zosterae]|uniref:SsuA/THI5-like domain-containing protein n=1 Tax=Thiosulfativibrio zosterae TaxID=2675053 RepID=A0A6F8PMU5_9GAMM|nr:hypothetical protein [Thiosulfativibrio zosterae]BBP43415.1 hypothetical protein THMIRHAT_11610 [Thiosulfativibrio zosterae]
MTRFHQTLVLFLGLWLSISLSGCSLQTEKPLKIIANSWIGYSPLFYAKEQGWLVENNIELYTVVSLGESLSLYENAGFDAFTGTQFEYQQAKKSKPDLMPVIMLDKSNGGDMVMSNGSIKQLQETPGQIDVYLEINSVNSLIFKDFIKANALTNKSFNFINQDQIKIHTEVTNRFKAKNPAEDPNKSPFFVVVTYEPFNHQLNKQGMTTISSTGDDLQLLVIDALYTEPKTFKKHAAQFRTLKLLLDRSLQDLHAHPKAYYEKVKIYLENPSYPEFLSSLDSIQWLNKDISPELNQRLQEAQFPLEATLN